MILHITVEERHLEGAWRGDSQRCPVAQAIKDHAQVERVYVLGSVVVIENKVYGLDSDTARRLAHWDAGASFPVPYTFALDMAAEAEGWTWR